MADMGHRNCEMFTSNKKSSSVLETVVQFYSFIRFSNVR